MSAGRRTLQSRLFPEYERFEPSEEGRRAAARFRRLLLRDWRFWLTMLALLVGCGLGGVVAGRLFRRLALDPAVLGGLVGGIVGGLAGLVVNLLYRRPLRRFLRTELVGRGVAICVPCGYDLRGLARPRCPECGAAFDPGLIGAVERKARGID